MCVYKVFLRNQMVGSLNMALKLPDDMFGFSAIYL